MRRERKPPPIQFIEQTMMMMMMKISRRHKNCSRIKLYEVDFYSTAVLLPFCRAALSIFPPTIAHT